MSIIIAGNKVGSSKKDEKPAKSDKKTTKSTKDDKKTK